MSLTGSVKLHSPNIFESLKAIGGKLFDDRVCYLHSSLPHCEKLFSPRVFQIEMRDDSVKTQMPQSPNNIPDIWQIHQCEIGNETLLQQQLFDDGHRAGRTMASAQQSQCR